jgi:putative SOS response-associated peptidase YedK
MCGRYKLSRRKQVVEEYFDVASSEEDWAPRYNIAPTQPVPVIRQHPKEPARQFVIDARAYQQRLGGLSLAASRSGKDQDVICAPSPRRTV